MFYISGDTIHPKGKISVVSSVNSSVKAANRERIVHTLLQWHMLAFIRAYNCYIKFCFSQSSVGCIHFEYRGMFVYTTFVIWVIFMPLHIIFSKILYMAFIGISFWL